MTACDDILTSSRPRLSRKLRILLFFLVETVAALLIGFAALFLSFEPGWSSESQQAALIKPGENLNDAHYRRSYVCKIVAREVNKFINLPVLKHHQSAGVTIALKNMSHGMVNNVNRSHLTPTNNACGIFIPSVVSLPVIREKAVLHICDAVKASYHGGPGGRPEYMWEHKTMYFATDPVALDKTGWKAIDAKRAQAGMASIALSKPDQASHYLNCQVEHIEIAGMLGLGEFDDAKIDVKRVKLG